MNSTNHLNGEVKRLGLAKSGLPQLIIYLAAVQNARQQPNKAICSVFGISTDSNQYYFVHLDVERELFVSKPFHWLTEKTEVVRWADRILSHAIRASPSSTPD